MWNNTSQFRTAFSCCSFHLVWDYMVWTVSLKKLLTPHPSGEHSILWMKLSLKEKQLMQPHRIVKLGCHYVSWLTALLNKLFCALSVLSLFPHCNYSQLPSCLSICSLQLPCPSLDPLLYHTQLWTRTTPALEETSEINMHHQYSGKSQQVRLTHIKKTGLPHNPCYSVGLISLR